MSAVAVLAMSDRHAEGGAPLERLLLPLGVDGACAPCLDRKNFGIKELSEELRDREAIISGATLGPAPDSVEEAET